VGNPQGEDTEQRDIGHVARLKPVPHPPAYGLAA
jgi:hypothetical protein